MTATATRNSLPACRASARRSREVMAHVAQAGGAEQRITERVDDDVAIGVPGEAPVVGGR